MNDIGLWLTPLVLLPGVGILILSTSNRFTRLHDEIHHLSAYGEETTLDVYDRLRRRARWLHHSLVTLYVCVGLFALSSLFGLVTVAWFGLSEWLAALILVLGIGSLFGASILLIRESVSALEILEEHLPS